INAGHNTPMLRRKSGAVERLTLGGLPLGIQTPHDYETGTAVLESGDVLVIFTDGLPEAENERSEEYGETRLQIVLNAAAAQAPVEILRQIMRDVDAFVATTPQHDDITCMVVKVT